MENNIIKEKKKGRPKKGENRNSKPVITITFNPDDKNDMELYNFIKSLDNSTASIKNAMKEYKYKKENEEAYLKGVMNEYMSTKAFNNNLKQVFLSSEMQNYLVDLFQNTHKEMHKKMDKTNKGFKKV